MFYTLKKNPKKLIIDQKCYLQIDLKMKKNKNKKKQCRQEDLLL